MEYEESIAFLGQWGRFQLIVFFLLFVSYVPNGLCVFSIVFLGASTKHHCLVPEVNLTQDWFNASIPVQVVDGKQELSRCRRYRLDVVRNLSAQGLIPGRDVNLTDLEQEGCVDGWSYSKDVYQSTIVTEFDLVCSEQWKQPFTSTVYFLGVLFGSFFSGQISDRFGRKPVLIATEIAQAIFSLVQIISPSWMVFSILFFFVGFSQTSNYVTALVLGTEIFTGNMRVIFSSLGFNIGFAIGYMLLPLFAYFLRDWKSLLLVSALPGFTFIPIWWFVPESPRWLLSQGRVEEAEAIVRRIAKFNKVEAPPTVFEGYRAQRDEKKKHHNVFHLVKTRNIRNTTIIVCLVWFSVRIGYYGLSLNTSRLHADPYISCFFSAAIEIPAYVSIYLALRYIPRRLTVIAILLIDLPYVDVALEMLGKFAVSVGAALMYVYTAELYPTVIRNTATGTCSTIARMGSCIAPFLFNLSLYFKYLPYITMATMALLSAFSVLFLPESFRQPLPENIKDMPKRQRVKWPFFSRKERLAPL